MKMISATEANRDFSKLLEQVIAGDEFVITKHGEIVATINPAKDFVAKAEARKLAHIAELRTRQPFAHVISRGTRDELYEND